MKFYFRLATLIAIIAIIIIACNKNDSLKNTNEPFDVSSSKEWWYGNFRKSAAYKAIDHTSPLTPSIGSSTKKYPDWKNAIAYKKFGIEVVELPLYYQTNNILLPGMQELNHTPEGARIAKAAIHRLQLFKKEQGEIIVRTITIVPSAQYAKKNNYDISHIKLEKLPLDFEGYLMIAGWDESVKNIVKIQGGKPVKKVKILTAAALAKKKTSGIVTETMVCPPPVCVPNMVLVCVIVPTGDAVADQERCEENGDWVEQGCNYEIPECYDDPEGEDPNPLGDCMNGGGSSEECYCALYGLGCGDPDPDPLPEIINNVENPCIKDMVNDAISLDCENKITEFVNTAFGNNENFHIVFYDAPLGTIIGEDGNAVCGPMTDPTQTKVTITLNNSPNTLNGASREYIAITIFHEILHAWIAYTSSSTMEELAEHELMASPTNLSLMADALQEMYPNIPRQDALDLAWGGLKSTAAWAALIQSDKNRINLTDSGYRSNTKGTPCTP